MEPSELRTAHVGGRKADSLEGVRQAYRSYVRRKWLVLVIVVIVLVGLIFASIMHGSSNLSAGEVLSALVGMGDAYTQTVIWDLRMPHILTALVGGIALALAGCAFQSVLNNPLASASTLGISQGAAFGASMAIIVLASFDPTASTAHDAIVFTSPASTATCAFVGALISMVVILALARFRDMTPQSIVLAGVALSAMFNGITALIQYFASDTQVAAVVFWTFGSLRRVGYSELGLMAAVTALSAVFFHFQRWNFNAMESGEGSAHGLGVSVKRVRLANMIVGTVAASTVIAFCGTINFIGLIAPHIMRRFIGSDYRYLLPASALSGAALLLISDLISSSIMPGVILPIGAFTSLIGAPLFLYLLMKGMHR